LLECDALSLVEIKRNGATKPLVVECELSLDNIPVRKTILLKTEGLPQISNLSLYCELCGNLLAREFDIETPEPFVVRVSEEFVAATRKVLWEESLKIEAGFGVGCEYFSQGFVGVNSNMALSKEKLGQAVMIYGFDLFSQNPDRKVTNPNCAIKGNRLVAFDFEKSLSFLYEILGPKVKPWELSKLFQYEKVWHLFKDSLSKRSKEIDWQPLIKRVKRIDKGKIEEICSQIPFQFGDYADKLVEHFEEIIVNNDRLEMELLRSLK